MLQEVNSAGPSRVHDCMYVQVADILTVYIHINSLLSQLSLLQDTEALGYIHMEEMLSVSRCEDDGVRDPRYKHCFEVNTQGRGYLFCADTEEDMRDWIQVFEKTIPPDAADNLVS